MAADSRLRRMRFCRLASLSSLRPLVFPSRSRLSSRSSSGAREQWLPPPSYGRFSCWRVRVATWLVVTVTVVRVGGNG